MTVQLERLQGEKERSDALPPPGRSNRCPSPGELRTWSRYEQTRSSTQVPTALQASSGSCLAASCSRKPWGCCKSCAVPAAPWGCGGVRHPSRGEQSVGTWGTQLRVCSGALNCSPGSADGASSISMGHCRSSESQLTPKHPCPVPVPNPSCLKIGG